MEENCVDGKIDEVEHEIVPFIGIPKRWVNPALKIYALLFVGYTIWIVYQEFSTASKTLTERFTFLVPHLGPFSVLEVILIVVLIQLWDILMYLTYRLRANLAKIAAQSRAEGRAEGEESGRAAAHQDWEAWYRRLQEANAKGLPFDEPPPALNGGKKDR